MNLAESLLLAGAWIAYRSHPSPIARDAAYRFFRAALDVDRVAADLVNERLGDGKWGRS